jgi:hypothetical protein
VKPPERGERRARQYLFPSEFLKFVSCEQVPLRWRRAVALAIYTYTRDGELRVLRWDGGDIDLEHGVLSVTRAYNRRAKTVKGTKTGDSRRFALEPNVLPLLQVLHDEAKAKGVVIDLPSERAMARNLRRWLWKANVRRPELHVGTPTRKSLTWHDLRATGATWMAVRGDDPLKIKQRCGHRTFSTTELYVREAEAVREGFGDPFPALPAALLGIAPNRLGRFSRSRSSQKQAVLSGVDGTRRQRGAWHRGGICGMSRGSGRWGDRKGRRYPPDPRHVGPFLGPPDGRRLGAREGPRESLGSRSLRRGHPAGSPARSAARS